MTIISMLKDQPYIDWPLKTRSMFLIGKNDEAKARIVELKERLGKGESVEAEINELVKDRNNFGLLPKKF